MRATRAAAPSGEQVAEFKSMVRALHREGIEVILDVVYNHTGEGNQLGPTLCFRGIDNASYYRLVEDDRRYYMDYTGCGNTLDMTHPRVLQLIMDSLRYWITEMHVDGFRFDLASALARELHDVDRLGAFFDIIHQDPIISQVKLIAEPWDLGPGGYQVGNFPVLWAEWNAAYRDTVRRFWKGDGGQVGGLGLSLDRIERSVRATMAGCPMRALISSPRTTALLCTIWSATTKSTTKPTAKKIATATTRISAGTAAPKATPTIPNMLEPARAAKKKFSGDTAVVPGRADACSLATKSAARNRATTTPIARTTRFPGSIGNSTGRGASCANLPAI